MNPVDLIVNFQDNSGLENFRIKNIMKENLNTYEKHAQPHAKACIIWMHGLGADARDMMGVAAAFPENLAASHVFIDAPIRPVTINNHIPMRAWYNILGIKLTDREDHEGIIASAKHINDIIDIQIAKGYQASQIFLAGFSQGGAMALYTGLNYSFKLGGIISLSAYLPLLSTIKIHHPEMPIFIGFGEQDQVVLPEWTKASYNWLQQQNCTNLTLHNYPMEHSICIEEIKDINNWLSSKISEMPLVETI